MIRYYSFLLVWSFVVHNASLHCGVPPLDDVELCTEILQRNGLLFIVRVM